MGNISAKVDNSSLQIKRGALISYIAIFINIVTGIIYTPWMIKLIGQSDYGLYALAITMISFFTIDFGLGQAVSRFLSKYNAEDEISKKNDFLGITFKLYLFIDIIIFISLVIVFVLSGTLYAKLTSIELEKFRIVFIIGAFYALSSFPFQPFNGILISHERFAFLKLADLINRILTVLTMVIVLVLGYRLYALVIVNAITGFITIGLKSYYIIRNKLVRVNFKAWDKKILKEITFFSGWTSVIVISQRFIFNITPTILAAVAGSSQIALFAIASTLEGFVWTFAAALNGLFLPKVTNLLLKIEGSKEIENLMIKVGRIQLTIVGLLFVGFIIVGKEFILLWLNIDFLDSYYIVIMLILPAIISVTQEIASTALIAKNEIKYSAYGTLIVGCLSFVLSIIFSQKWGALGAGIAIFIGNLLGAIIFMNIVYHKVLKINITRFFRECHLKMITPLLVTIFVGYLLNFIIPGKSWLLFIIKVIVISLNYFLLIWNIFFNDFEKNVVGSLVLKILRRK